MPRIAMRSRIASLLEAAGVAIDGAAPHDIRIHDDRFYPRVLAGGSLALGESYLDGWWDCDHLDEFFTRILRAGLDARVRARAWWVHDVKARLRNRQTRARASRSARHHYDLGNDLYRCMLDRRMIYSCGYWERARTLDEAQEAKLDLVCRKLRLEPGMRVLDIGCGWGGTARWLAERHGVAVVGVTVSPPQVDLARETCRDLPVEIRLQDYRDLDEPFDRIVSLGMFEHVGYRNYRTFMQVVRRCLKDDGLFLLHTIGCNTRGLRGDAWIDRYIFPDSMLPSARQLAGASEGSLVLEDWHGFGQDYDPTLMQWHRNVVAHRDELRPRYDERFFRMWSYYLLSCAASFRARRNQVWQLVFSPRGVAGGYRSVR
ncbi:MAG TPA: cyclopropane fatty acyl phospholipid synthase [Candidatus Krumholzibacteria bacterium]|nr:cyclopropane fatty acyl phospholipid synthase [Candidatus Krumholzibacteria bacterium]HPD72943.1 cyclopropane fatty acyl phospholipid synthase [Candidatus Krumholzibacteria bacterium]HRY41742.1 cyclopropane fatty acyl phospholipid synthase [Candidatus Krumholzibacteria bacterium]